MSRKNASNIRHAQRTANLLQKLSAFFLQICQDNEKLRTLYISRVKLSSDGGLCAVFFHSNEGPEAFERLRPELVLYKPSMRTALARSLHSRRVPNLRFVYDAQFDKQRHVDDLIERLKQEGKL